MANKTSLRGATATKQSRFLVVWITIISVVVPGQIGYAADLKGQVRLDGPLPAAEKVTIQPKKGGNHSTEGCGSLLKDSQRLRVDAVGGIRDAVVWLELPNLPDAAVPPAVLIDQNQCVFEPHVAALPAGGSIAVRNSDSVIHNIRIFREGKPDMLMHQWQKADAADIPWRFKEPGRFIVRCGVHHWMYSWVFVAPPGRMAVTDQAGRFTLVGVPAGKHKVKVWHETLGEKELSVQVPEKEADSVEIRYPPVVQSTGTST